MTILDFTLEELEEKLIQLNEKKYRAKQIFLEIMQGKSLDEISTLSSNLKEKLKDTFEDRPVKIEKVFSSKDGTKKLLFRLHDNNLIEGVIMSYKFGYTLCVSSQIGCRMHCKFCASGLEGLVRNLDAGEMVSQVILANNLLGGTLKERKITNIVLMGSGEPLDNYDNVIKFIKIVTSPFGLNIAKRNISLSTCGIVPNIYKLADTGLNIHLCLSLHAPNDEIRNKIMPISIAYKIRDVLSAIKYYFEKTKRRILIEYILIDGVNSSKENALQLAKLLGNLNCLVNLINLNEVKENNFKSCSKEKIDSFAKILKSYNINVTTRRSLGDDIEGACGQLRRRYISTLKISASTNPPKSVEEMLKYVELLNSTQIDYLHCDVMDGQFVENKTYDDKMVERLKTLSLKPLDVHLMTKNTLEVYENYLKSHPKILTVHYESLKETEIENVLKTIKNEGVLAGLSIKPDTNIQKIYKFLDKIDVLLLMSVNPGKSGQEFLEESIMRLKNLYDYRSTHKLKFLIEVDGGVTDKVAKKIKDFCDIVVCGNYLYKSCDISQSIKQIKDL